MVRENPPCIQKFEVDNKTVEKELSTAECQKDVQDRTRNLVNQFNASIGDGRYFFDDEHHYPWEEGASTSQKELQKAIQTNPYVGAYYLTWFAADKQGGGAPTPPSQLSIILQRKTLCVTQAMHRGELSWRTDG